MKLSIVVPAHNEEENIVEVVKRIERSITIGHELIIVNDHSKDKTVELVSELYKDYSNLRLVENIGDPGFANAIKTGFANIKTDVVVPVMGDLCDDLDTISAMFKKIEEGFDVVCGSRYIRGGARLGGSRLKGFFSCAVGKSLSLLLGLPTHDIANAFKMYKKKVLDSINIDAKGFEISMEIPLKAYYLGFKITEVPTIWQERTRGKSSFKMFKLFPAYLRFYLWAIKKRIFK